MLLVVGGSGGICSQGRLNSLFNIFRKHANFFTVPNRLFTISSLNLYVHCRVLKYGCSNFTLEL